MIKASRKTPAFYVSLIFVCGCAPEVGPTSTQPVASQNPISYPVNNNASSASDPLIASWRKVVENISNNYARLSQLSRIGMPANLWPKYEVVSDLKKSDSVLSPYIGEVTLIQFITGDNINVKIEFSFDGNTWVPRGGRYTRTNKAGQRVDKPISAEHASHILNTDYQQLKELAAIHSK